jgi:hypothetical protein
MCTCYLNEKLNLFWKPVPGSLAIYIAFQNNMQRLHYTKDAWTQLIVFASVILEVGICRYFWAHADHIAPVKSAGMLSKIPAHRHNILDSM